MQRLLVEVLAEVYALYPRGLLLTDKGYKKSDEYLKRKFMKEREEKSGHLHTVYQEIKRVFINYEVANWSNIKEYPCYEFIVLLHKDQPILDDDIELIRQLHGKRHDLYLFVSYISKYYCYYIRETNYLNEEGEWSFKKIRLEDREDIAESVRSMNDYFTKKGFELLTHDILSYRLPDIDLEIVPYGEVTIFHCIFTDLIDFILKN